MSASDAHPQARITRRGLLSAVLIGLGFTSFPAFALLRGRNPLTGKWIGQHEKVWGRRGVAKGRLHKPRAVTSDAKDRIYIVDKTARIQVYDPEGEYLTGWRTPDYANGKPTGLSICRDGNLLVADTHYYRVLFYSPDGKLLEEKSIGGTMGNGPGQFGLVTDAVEDSAGNIYVAEYGEFDRIQKFSADGQFLLQWGSHGQLPGQFVRPQNLAVDENDHIWVADACNHRVQVFDATGDAARQVTVWGQHGYDLGQLRYPYDLVPDRSGHVYICEWGNHRVQKFTTEGVSVGHWGTTGRGTEQMHNPWGICRDTRGRLHVLDTYNHRVHRIWL